MMEARQALSKQIFQLSYFGKISAEYVSGLEISERNYVYKMLKEQLDSENKAAEGKGSNAAAQSAAIRSKMNQRKR